MLHISDATKLEVKQKGVWDPIEAGQVEAGDLVRLLDSDGTLILQGKASADFRVGFAEMLDPSDE